MKLVDMKSRKCGVCVYLLSSGYFYPTSFSTEHSVWYRDRQEATKNQSFWAFSIWPNTVDILFTNQKELAILVLSDQNIRDLLGRWPTLTSPVNSVGQSDLQ